MYKSHSALMQYHLIHIAATPGVFWWLDASNEINPPSNRVSAVTCFMTVIQIIATSLYVFGKSKKEDNYQEISSFVSRVRNLAEPSFILVSSALLFHLIIVLLGGPVLDHFEGTLCLSWMLSVIAVAPLLTVKQSQFNVCYQNVPAMSTRSQTKKRAKFTKSIQESLVIEGCLSESNSETFQEQLRRTNPLISGVDALDSYQIQNFYFVIVGVWFSVFFIKLDWMQPWQEYPVTCIVSSLILNFLSHSTHFLFILFSNLSM